MSPLYSMMKEHKETQNMRTDPEEVTFSDYILNKLGLSCAKLILS
jgi:hypothetical protein